MANSAVVLLSGGIDSSTLLYHLDRKGYDLYPLSIIYGQKHSREINSAREIAKSLGLELKVADLSSISEIFSGSSLTSDEPVPEGHYTAENMASTVVPNRNMVLLSLAAAYALSLKCNYVAYAAHAGDHAIYADCRPEFVTSVSETIKLATETVEVINPFINITKADIVKEGLRLGVPYIDSWSCYVGKDRPCLKCGTCVEREESFLLNGAKDPLLTDTEWKIAVDILENI